MSLCIHHSGIFGGLNCPECRCNDLVKRLAAAESLAEQRGKALEMLRDNLQIQHPGELVSRLGRGITGEEANAILAALAGRHDGEA